MLQMSAFSHTILGTYALIGFTITGLSFLRSWVTRQYAGSWKSLQEECNRLRQTVRQQEQRIDGLKDLVARTTAERDRQEAELQQLRADVEQLTTEATDLRTQHQTLAAELAACRQQVQDLQTELVNSQGENERLRDTCDRHRAELEAAYRHSSELEEANSAQVATLATLAAAHREQESQLQACQGSLRDRDTVIANLQTALEQVHQQQQQSNYSTQLLAWLSGSMTVACLVLGLGPWSPLRPLWEAIYPHLPMFH